MVIFIRHNYHRGGQLMNNENKKGKEDTNAKGDKKGKDDNSPEKKFRLKVAHVLVMISFYLELIIASFVIVLIIYGIIGLLINFLHDARGITNLSLFSHYIEKALNIVVGIEFLKMLCRHSLASVVEVILFYLSRSLIVETTTMTEGLLCVIAVAGLFAIRKYLFIPKVDDPAIDVRNSPLVYIRKYANKKRGNPESQSGR